MIDARGHLATPGFVNVHTHAVLSLARGMTEDMGFAPAYTPGVPHAYDITEDEAVALGRLTALEAMLFGSTIINDMYIHAHATLPAIAELGLRISSSGWIHDVDFTQVHNKVWDYDRKIGEDRLRYGVDLYDRLNGAFDGRASVMLAPHAIDTCSRDFLRDVNSERRRLGVRVMTHLAQSYMEVEQVRKRDGMTPTELLDDIGLLDEGLIAAHCTVMTEDDIARAGRGGITVAHAPKVNLTGGYLPVTSKLRRAGARDRARHRQHAWRHGREHALGAGIRAAAGEGRQRFLGRAGRLPHGDARRREIARARARPRQPDASERRPTWCCSISAARI